MALVSSALRCWEYGRNHNKGNKIGGFGCVSRLSGTDAAAYLLPVQHVKQWESTTYRFGEEPGNPLKTLTFSSS